MKGGIDDSPTPDMMVTKSVSNSFVTGIAFIEISLFISDISFISTLFLARSCCSVSFILDEDVIDTGAFKLAAVSSRLDFCLEDLSSTLESFEQKMHGDFCPNSGNKITKHEGDLEYSV